MAQPKIFDYDLYALLGVDSTATLDVIKEVSKVRTLKMHPDTVGNTPSNTERFTRLQKGIEILQCPIRRSEYDNYRNEQEPKTNKRKATVNEPCVEIKQEKRSKLETSRKQSNQDAPDKVLVLETPTQRRWHQRMVRDLEFYLVGVEREIEANSNSLKKIKAGIELCYDSKPKSFWDSILMGIDVVEGYALEVSAHFKTRLANAKMGYLSDNEMHNLPREVSMLNEQLFRAKYAALAVETILDDLKSSSAKSDAEKGKLVSDILRELNIWAASEVQDDLL